MNHHTTDATKTLAALTLFAALCAGGCGAPPATFERWQSDVRTHVAAEGHGDINTLRNMSEMHGRPVFISMGAKDPGSTSDVVGVLLGQPMIGQNPMAVYLVSRVQNRTPHDMRLAAVYDDGGDDLRPIVKLGPVDASATKRYVEHLKPGRSVNTIWPPASDVYELAVTDHRVSVTEKNSGATWAMQLSPRAEP